MIGEGCKLSPLLLCSVLGRYATQLLARNLDNEGMLHCLLVLLYKCMQCFCIQAAEEDEHHEQAPFQNESSNKCIPSKVGSSKHSGKDVKSAINVFQEPWPPSNHDEDIYGIHLGAERRRQHVEEEKR